MCCSLEREERRQAFREGIMRAKEDIEAEYTAEESEVDEEEREGTVVFPIRLRKRIQ